MNQPNCNNPPWYAAAPAFQGDRLQIIGAGIAGAALAYVAAKNGYRVDIYEQKTLAAAGASGNAAGIIRPLTNHRDERFDLFTQAIESFEALAETWDHADTLLSTQLNHVQHGAIVDARIINPQRWIARLLAHPRICLHNLSPWSPILRVKEAALVYANGWELYHQGWPLDGGYRSVQWTRFSNIEPPPNQNLVGRGYLCSDANGGWIVGPAHKSHHPQKPNLLAGHLENLRVLGDLIADLRSAQCHSGRAGLRSSAPGRWPILGPIPDFVFARQAYAELARGFPAQHYAQCQYLPQHYMIGALGSRGLTLAPLCAELLLEQLQGLRLQPKTAVINGLLRGLRKPRRESDRAKLRGTFYPSESNHDV